MLGCVYGVCTCECRCWWHAEHVLDLLELELDRGGCELADVVASARLWSSAEPVCSQPLDHPSSLGKKDFVVILKQALTV